MLFSKKKEVVPEIYSEETCQFCREKIKRPFEEGDHVYGVDIPKKTSIRA
jgi:hypothetical protein